MPLPPPLPPVSFIFLECFVHEVFSPDMVASSKSLLSHIPVF